MTHFLISLCFFLLGNIFLAKLIQNCILNSNEDLSWFIENWNSLKNRKDDFLQLLHDQREIMYGLLNYVL